MPKWVCTAIAAALWPAAMTIGVVLISPPILALYDGGALGASPLAPMTFISIGALVLSVGLCFVLRALLRAAAKHDAMRADASREVSREL